jgi:hypothetical protein
MEDYDKRGDQHDTEPVQIMGNKRPWRLQDLYDPATGRYFSPTPPPRAKEVLKRGYLQLAPAASEARFDSGTARLRAST